MKKIAENQDETTHKKVKLGKRKKSETNNEENLKQKKKKLRVKPEIEDASVPAKPKKEKKSKENKPNNLEKPSKFEKSSKKHDPTTNLKGSKPKKFVHNKNGSNKNASKQQQLAEKPEDWNKFKKEKKELKIKRKQARTKDFFEVILKAKKLGEKLRMKTMKEEARQSIISELNDLLKGNYAKVVLAHDTARIVQWLLKYSNETLIHEISKEIVPVTVNMLQSKYGIHCVKRLLKYGQNDIRSEVVNQLIGHAVKLSSHSVSAAVVEYAYSNWASAQQKQYLVQEFYGGLYRNSKDPNVKHLRDVYKDNENMKAATLSACKANIKKILDKSLLDSGLVQSVLCQFLQECSEQDREELITELAPHIVVISNSKDGSRAAMQCIWHGTNKQRKVIMKALKEHLLDLSKHEFGHCTIITILDTIDDTVLLHKIILGEILKNAKELAISEWGRKVLLWLVAPANPTVFHPKFINEMNAGRESSKSKKSAETRRLEILNYSVATLLNLIKDEPAFWLANASVAMETLTIIKAGGGKELENALTKIVETITDLNWKIKEENKEMMGIEHAGLHMVLKKLAQHDKIALENNNFTFGKCLVDALDDDVIKEWLKINRSCFILVAVFENNTEIYKDLKGKLKPHLKLLKSQTSTGAKILLKKIK